jgi:pilus assembly protein CpaF
LLRDPSVTDICLNGVDQLFVDRGAGLRAETPPAWDAERMRGWVLEQLSACGRTWDARHPFVDATLPSGHRLHAAFPPVSGPRILVSLRRLARADGERTERWRGDPKYALLAQAVARGETLILSGATGSGKTTLAAELLQEVPPDERIIALEDTPELAPPHPHFVSLTSRPPNSDGCGEVTLRTLLRQTLRMRPDRIVLGECRGPEVLELLQALNTGHRGSLATLHANSARDALRRIEVLCLLAAGAALPLLALRDLLATGIQWVAQVERTAAGRRIAQVQRVDGREGEQILLRPL